MNTKVVTGIVVVLALVVLGWWYWAYMTPSAMTPAGEAPAPEESVNGAAMSDADAGTALAGVWQSAEDARFTREFRADGTVIDRYEGTDGATISGTWSFVADPASEQAELPVVKDAKVVKVQFPEEVMYFAVTEISATSLSMAYLSGNGSLEFSRVQ